MKPANWLLKLGKYMMRKGSLSVVIADDEDAYFNSHMLIAAEAAGFGQIDRISFVTSEIFNGWLKKIQT